MRKNGGKASNAIRDGWRDRSTRILRVPESCRAGVVAITLLAFVSAHLATSDSAAAQSDVDRAEAAEHGFDGSLEADRFAVFWRTADGSEDEVQQILGTLDRYYEGIAQLVGPERTPQGRIVVVLGGHGQGPDGRWRFPNVNRQGRVMLYQYSGEFTDHTVEAAHELVHAFRRAAGFWYSGFWEEGFAEAIAMAVDPDDVGFPRFGG